MVIDFSKHGFEPLGSDIWYKELGDFCMSVEVEDGGYYCSITLGSSYVVSQGITLGSSYVVSQGQVEAKDAMDIDSWFAKEICKFIGEAVSSLSL